jgi:hypothetical protein
MYGQLPEVIGNFETNSKELLWFQYLPIKMSKCTLYKVEERLYEFCPLINIVIKDYIKTFGLKDFLDSYIYLTAKRQYQKKNYGFNREGFHSDGYNSLDINYIWASSQPTIFNTSKFNLSQDDKLSLKEMEEQADPQNNITFPLNSILRLNQYVIHKVGEIEEGVRTFVKISFSKDKYDLEGNSHNYLLGYNWEMRPRNKERNIPQQLG